MKPDGSPSISYNITAQRLRRCSFTCSTYWWTVVVALCRSPWSEGEKRSGKFFKGAKAAPVALSETLDASADELVRVAREFGFEGIVAKRKDSLYESGKRTGAWVKYKVNRGQEFVIGGYTPGNPFDARIVGYYEGDRLMYAAKVRNTASCRDFGVTWQISLRGYRSTLVRLLTCPSGSAPNGL